MPFQFIRGAIAAVGLVSLAAGMVQAQVPATLAPGARVRVRTADRALTGTVIAINDTALLVQDDWFRDTVEFAVARVLNAHMVSGRRASPGAQALGFFAGLPIGLGACRAVRASHCISYGAVVGVGLGYLLGWRVQVDRWTRVGISAPPAPLAGETAVNRASPTDIPLDSGTRSPVDAPAPVPVERREPSGLGGFGTDPLTFNGERIRYETYDAHGVKRVARVVRVAGDTLVLARDTTPGKTLRIPADSMLEVQFSQGLFRCSAQGAGVGAILGGAAALLEVSLICMHRGCDSADFAFGTFLLGAVGITVGTGVGAAIGAAVTRERWGPPLRHAGLTSPPNGSVRLALTLRP